MQHPYDNPYGGMMWVDNFKKIYEMMWLESYYSSQFTQGKIFFLISKIFNYSELCYGFKLFKIFLIYVSLINSLTATIKEKKNMFFFIIYDTKYELILKNHFK